MEKSIALKIVILHWFILFLFFKQEFDLLYYFFLQDAVKIMAKDLVRTRRYVKKFILMKANLQAVSLKIQVCK